MKTDTIRGAVVSADEALRDVARTAGDEVSVEWGLMLDPTVSAGDEAFHALSDAGPQIVLIDLDGDPRSGVSLAAKIAEVAPEVVLLSAGGDVEASTLIEAMRAGFREYLRKPVRPGDLTQAISRANGNGHVPGKQPGKIFTFFSAKGGTGTTTVATNVGIHMHQVTGRRTLLVDLDTELGEIASFLGIQARFNLVDLMKNFHRMDADLLTSYIESHESGVHVLSAPFQPEPGQQLTGELAHSVLSFLRSHYDYVIVDASKSLTPGALAAVRDADEVLLIANLDIPSIRNLKRSLAALKEGVLEDPERVKLVVNRYNPKSLISVEDLEETLGTRVHRTLCNDYQSVIEAISTSRPIVMNQDCRYSREIKELAAELAGVPASEGGTRTPLLQALTAPLRGMVGGRSNGGREVAQHA